MPFKYWIRFMLLVLRIFAGQVIAQFDFNVLYNSVVALQLQYYSYFYSWNFLYDVERNVFMCLFLTVSYLPLFAINPPTLRILSFKQGQYCRVATTQDKMIFYFIGTHLQHQYVPSHIQMNGIWMSCFVEALNPRLHGPQVGGTEMH